VWIERFKELLGYEADTGVSALKLPAHGALSYIYTYVYVSDGAFSVWLERFKKFTAQNADTEV
jgi:hypothetical protein